MDRIRRLIRRVVFGIYALMAILVNGAVLQRLSVQDVSREVIYNTVSLNILLGTMAVLVHIFTMRNEELVAPKSVRLFCLVLVLLGTLLFTFSTL